MRRRARGYYGAPELFNHLQLGCKEALQHARAYDSAEVTVVFDDSRVAVEERLPGFHICDLFAEKIMYEMLVFYRNQSMTCIIELTNPSEDTESKTLDIWTNRSNMRVNEHASVEFDPHGILINARSKRIRDNLSAAKRHDAVMLALILLSALNPADGLVRHYRY